MTRRIIEQSSIRTILKFWKTFRTFRSSNLVVKLRKTKNLKE